MWCVVFSLCAAVSGADSISSALSSTLEGRGANVTHVQKALVQTLRAYATAPSGAIVSGNAPSVEDLPAKSVTGEVVPEATVFSYLHVGGRGPTPLRVTVPVPPISKRERLGAYQRITPGVFLETDAKLMAGGRYLRFDCTAPGDYVVAQKPKIEDKTLLGPLFPTPPPRSTEPEAKKSWRLFRVSPEQIAGSVPLLLVHGANNDRWGEFSEWATSSPEAAGFRERYQLWNFRHQMQGVNASVGFDPACPEYEESISAYLARFMQQAETQGTVADDGQTYLFPAGPFSILTHSHGALKARAFMVHYPEYGSRVLACITLGGPHLGSPLTTAEWARHTVSRLGLGRVNLLPYALDFLFAVDYFALGSQNDLDTAWGNFDGTAGMGFPYKRFETWTRDRGWQDRVISPRDANLSYARDLPGYEKDTTFEPQIPLETWCGGLDQIHPAKRGDLYTDRIIAYGTYLEGPFDLGGIVIRSGRGLMSPLKNLGESLGMQITTFMMGMFDTPGGRWPANPYRINDGLIPLQSQLMVDGEMDRPPYKTNRILGWSVPAFPLRPDVEAIKAHTLLKPEHLRILPGWSHLETVTGRYDRFTGHSEVFCMIRDDLLGVL